MKGTGEFDDMVEADHSVESTKPSKSQTSGATGAIFANSRERTSFLRSNGRNNSLFSTAGRGGGQATNYMSPLPDQYRARDRKSLFGSGGSTSGGNGGAQNLKTKTAFGGLTVRTLMERASSR